MAWRLVVTLPTGPQRFGLPPGEHLVGSDPACHVCLDHPSVSRRHATIRIGAATGEIEDLGSSNGTIVGARRLGRAPVSPGAAIYFGLVPATIEDVAAADLEVGLAMPVAAAPTAPEPRSSPGDTAAFEPVAAFAIAALPRLLARVQSGEIEAVMAADAGQALYAAVPCLSLAVTHRTRQGDAVLFRAARPADAPAGAPVSIDREREGVCVSAVFPGRGVAEACAPLLDITLSLVLLARRDRAGNDVPTRVRPVTDPPSPPDPPSVVPQVSTIYRQAARVARGDVSVLITGESGTGKELLARYLHAASSRADGPFVALNCAAVPRDLLEAELFGIERGVATGVDSRPGRFELADAGTLFLDEVGDMAPDTQARILRVLQERQVYRLGGRDPRPARGRVVAATNRDLAPMLADGRFREDLYHRIATWVVELPPLRHRLADVPQLAAHFLSREARRHGRRIGGLSRAAVDALVSCPWPGNIRQLENEMARAVLFLEDGDLVETSHLNPALLKGPRLRRTGTLADQIEATTQRAYTDALMAAGGDVTAAAAQLGVSRATLYRKVKSLGLDVPVSD